MSKPYRIGIPIYANVDVTDVTVPADTLGWLNTFWERPVTIDLIAEAMKPLPTGVQMGGKPLMLEPTAIFRDYKRVQLDLILVPGSGDPTVDQAYIDFLKAQARGAQWVTSVCTGALLLAQAGLLDGYRATTYWRSIPSMQTTYPNVRVVNGYPRYVVDRNRVTGGGISSSMDTAIKLCELITKSPLIAQSVQLTMQYNPDPPFVGGDPCAASWEAYENVLAK